MCCSHTSSIMWMRYIFWYIFFINTIQNIRWWSGTWCLFVFKNKSLDDQVMEQITCMLDINLWYTYTQQQHAPAQPDIFKYPHDLPYFGCSSFIDLFLKCILRRTCYSCSNNFSTCNQLIWNLKLLIYIFQMEFRFPSKPIFFTKLSHTCVGRQM